jgi:hypothetical protein
MPDRQVHWLTIRQSGAWVDSEPNRFARAEHASVLVNSRRALASVALVGDMDRNQRIVCTMSEGRSSMRDRHLFRRSGRHLAPRDARTSCVDAAAAPLHCRVLQVDYAVGQLPGGLEWLRV